MSENKELKGLDGWLILVAIGLVISPFSLIFDLYSIVQAYQEIPWEELDAQAIGTALKALVVGEFVVNSILFIFLLLVIRLFFKKHYLFPKAYIVLLVIFLVLIPLDSWLVNLLIPAEEVFDFDTLKSTIRIALQCLIWIPYMLVSKRVKNTFVEGRKVA